MERIKINDKVFDRLPDPAEVRRNLAQTVREASILRRLLKVCEAAVAERSRNSEREAARV